MIAGGGGDYSAGARIGRERCERVIGAADFEGAGDLLALELEVDIGADELRESVRMTE